MIYLILNRRIEKPQCEKTNSKRFQGGKQIWKLLSYLRRLMTFRIIELWSFQLMQKSGLETSKVNVISRSLS